MSEQYYSKGSKRAKAQRRAARIALMQRYGTNDPHEATKRAFIDLAEATRLAAERLDRKPLHEMTDDEYAFWLRRHKITGMAAAAADRKRRLGRK